MTKLQMNNNSIAELPTEVGLLSKLGWFNLNYNNIHGTIPQAVGQMTTLYDLGLNGNNLSGSIPSELGLVTWLGFLRLEDNRLTGMVPSELGSLEPPMRDSINDELFVPPNSYDDQRARALAVSSKVQSRSFVYSFFVLDLFLSGNNLNGTLPDELGHLGRNSSFMNLYLGGNDFSGTIPEAFCFVSALDFDCSGGLCGCDCTCAVTLPPGFDSNARMILVNEFLLNHNASRQEDFEREGSPQQRALDFMATKDALLLDVPSTFDDTYKFLSRYALAVLFYSTNGPAWSTDLNFLQPMDTCFWYNSSLFHRAVICDEITGAITGLHIAGNNMVGTIPEELGLLTTLVTLNFESNTLRGSIPSAIYDMTDLATIFLPWNQLTGSIAYPTATELVDLSHNLISGALPTAVPLATQRALWTLNLDDNLLTNTIPSVLHDLQELNELHLGNNLLSGRIPIDLPAMLDNVFFLDLSHNSLTGPIPSEFGLMDPLFGSLLGSNILTGKLPTELGALDWCSELDFSNNRLTGTIPPELCGIGASSYDNSKLVLWGNNVTGGFDNETCVEVVYEPPVKWPGQFPSPNSTHELGINILFDSFPAETEWFLEQGPIGERNISGQLDTIASGRFSSETYVYINQTLAPETFCLFTVTNSYGDGFREGEGWVTLTNGTVSEDSPKGSIVWSLDTSRRFSVVSVYIWVDQQERTMVLEEAYII